MQPDNLPSQQKIIYNTPPPTEPQNFNKTNKRESWKSAISTILILIIAPLIALLLTTFVFQSYEVDGPSMENTLQNKDRLIVWKMPRSISKLTGKPYIPKRGDVVIFILHGIAQYDPSQDKQLIKRVIGIPGDRVVVKGSEITIYNSEHPDGYNPDNQGKYKVIKNEHGDDDINVDMVIKDDEIFVAGDNRPNSLDSRRFGAVPAQDIVGTLSYRIFPINKAESF